MQVLVQSVGPLRGVWFAINPCAEHRMPVTLPGGSSADVAKATFWGARQASSSIDQVLLWHTCGCRAESAGAQGTVTV